MYNSFPMTLTVESQLQVNKGHSIICNASTSDQASTLIEVVCKKMSIDMKSHHFLRLDNGKVIHGNDNLGEALENKGNHHHNVQLDTYYVSKVRWLGAVAGTVLSLAAILVAAILFSHKLPRWNYGIVADAGSSHTSFLLYNWPESHLDEVNQIGECKTEGSGGIDAFLSNPEAVKPHLQYCLTTLANELAEKDVTDLSTVKIYLGATAGMRLANTTSPENSTKIMNNIKETFTQSEFYFTHSDSKVLSGQEEGAFSWITTNILAGTLNNGDSQSTSESTFGSLDMGGASMQVAFQCLPDQCEDKLSFDLYNKKYEVFGRSDLCYGLSEAMKRYIVSLIYTQYKSNNNKIVRELPNPCLTRGTLLKDDWLVNFTSTAKDIFDSPCTTGLKDAEFAAAVEQLSADFEFVPQKSGKNSTDCHKAVSFFVDPVQCSALFGPENCFDFEPEEVHMPDLPAYYAMSSYFYEFFRYLNTSSSNVTYEFANNRVDELCSPDFVAPQDGESLYSQTDCFQATYIFDIITRGYKKFDNNNFDTIFFALDINGAEVAWPLGFVVNEINRFSAAKLDKKALIQTEMFVCLMVFGIFLLGLSLIAVRNFWGRHTAFRKMRSRSDH